MSKAKLAFRETAAPTVALVTSLSTLICCTLPAVMITLGMGAALSYLAFRTQAACLWRLVYFALPSLAREIHNA